MADPAATEAADLVDGFLGTPNDRLAAVFQRLAEALWRQGRPTELAVPAAAELADRLPGTDDTRRGYVAILLGLLLEAGLPDPDERIVRAVRDRLPAILELWRGTGPTPVRLALMFLLAHFPSDRDAVLAVAVGLGIDADDMSRLDRALATLDAADPVVGRMFPYPAVWAELDDAEKKADQAWIDALTPEQVTFHWNNDTLTILGTMGAKAYWAVGNGLPAPVVPDEVMPRDPHPQDADPELFRRHDETIRCSQCGGRLTFAATVARCESCGTGFSVAKGILNLTTPLDDGSEHSDDFLYQLANMTSMAYFINAYARPNFKRLCGMNYDDRVNPAWEDEYIATHVQPVDGPVLDLAAGGGRWTKVLADAVGAERVVPIDLLPSILASLRYRLPEIPAVVANARKIPFPDASFGAALCWNALQAFPAEAPAAIAEIGRVLRPGGTFSLFTFWNSGDPIYAHFVGLHNFPQHAGGLHLFDWADLHTWLAEAGLRIRDTAHHGLCFILTAEKIDPAVQP